AIRVVVLALVAHQIVQREAVVTGDEVDAGEGAAVASVENIARAGQAGRKLRHLPLIATPKAASAVAVAAVPLRPPRRKAAQAVAAGSQIPRLGDELHAREHRILLDGGKKPREAVELEGVTRQRRREVEAEAVDVHLRHPVAQAI